MTRQMAGVKKASLRARRRASLFVAYTFVAAGLGIAFALPAGAQATRPAGNSPATRPAQVSPANAAAADAQFTKAKDLYDHQKFADAQVENEKALQLDPTNKDALLLRRVLADKLAGGTTGTGAGTQAGPAGKSNVLTAQQISVLRLHELSPGDRALRGKIDRKVLDEFWNEVETQDPLVSDKSIQAHDAFVNPANFAGQVRRIKESRQQKYLEQVQLASDPASIVAFRNTVHSYMLQNCATSECHGADKGGNFRLVPSSSGVGAPTAEQQLYTNFYIMAMYANHDGKMIDRDSADKSLFVQYGLPWAAAILKHPKIEARKLTGTSDLRYRNMSEWVKLLAFPQPNYGLSFDVPGMPRAVPAAPASQPVNPK